MKCFRCQHENPSGLKFCGECGARLALVCGELNMRPLVAHCHLGMGRLYRRTSRDSEGKAELLRARDLYREMDMQFWLEQAEVEMRGLA